MRHLYRSSWNFVISRVYRQHSSSVSSASSSSLQLFPSRSCVRHASMESHKTATTSGNKNCSDQVQEVAKEMSKVVVRSSSDWEKVWITGGKDGSLIMPGDKFDAGKPSPMLEHVIAASITDTNINSFGAVDVKDKRVLVPGCGRGYDVIAFYEAGASESLGIDLAPTGVEVAQEVLANHALSDAAKMKCKVVEADFYTLPSSDHMMPSSSSSSSGDALNTFDIVYDYTFFCAMRPEQRVDWRDMMSKIVTPQSGQLWCLVFPISDHEGGPPFAVSVQLYESLLESYFTRVSVTPVPKEKSHPNRDGKEVFVVYQRK